MTTSSDYQNLYALLGEQNPTNNCAQNLIETPETQQSLKDRIKSSEKLLFSDDNSHYIPEVEGFLELLSKRFDISRAPLKMDVMDKPVISVDLLGIGDMSTPLTPTAPPSMPPTAPDVEPVIPVTVPAHDRMEAASNIPAPLIVSDASALKEIRDELRKTREEVSRAQQRQTRKSVV